MTNTTLSRLSGLTLISAFALCLAGGVMHPVIEGESHGASAYAHPRFPVAHVLIFLGSALLLMGLPGLYARIAPKAGLLGLVGFALYFLANATTIQGFTAYEAFVVPVLTDLAVADPTALDGAISGATPFAVLLGVGGPVLMLGMLLLGISVARSPALPRWSGILLAAAPVFLLLPIPEAPVLTGLLIELPRGLAVAAMGYTLFTHKIEERPTTPRPAATESARSGTPAA